MQFVALLFAMAGVAIAQTEEATPNPTIGTTLAAITQPAQVTEVADDTCSTTESNCYYS